MQLVGQRSPELRGRRLRASSAFPTRIGLDADRPHQGQRQLSRRWHELADASSPTRIELCGAMCESLRTSDVQVEFGCDTVEQPPR